MNTYLHSYKHIYFILFLALLLGSCTATYQQRMQRYDAQMANGEYEKAFNQLDDIKLLQKSRNRFLYLAEKGRAANLLGWYDSSNAFFNQADYFLEDNRKNVGDAISSNLLNPMMETYTGEDFERFLVHFYKAVNYLQLGNTEEAVVEARRISLVNYWQEEVSKGKENKYNGDAFSLILQGMIYEKAAQLNNAFISYRNAADLFLKKDNQELYGVKIPEQLKKDLLRMTYQLGFTNELEYYQTAFNTTYQPQDLSNGELLLFWENGKAPVKQQMNPAYNLFFQNDQYYFMNTSSRERYDLDNSFSNDHVSMLQRTPSLLTDLFRITLPYYTSTQPLYQSAIAVLDSSNYAFEEGVDVNILANTTLKERQGKEIAKALTRLLVKKLTEVSAGAVAKSIATPKASDKKESEKTAAEKKKEQQKKDQAEAIGAGVELLVKLFNTASEKADTRNWQSLPSAIHYVRIPLHSGTNNITVRFAGAHGEQTQNITVEANGSMQVKQLSLLQ